MASKGRRTVMQEQKSDRRQKPLALYIHIPFCVKKCLYCDFLSQQATKQEMDAYLITLTEEMRQWSEVLSGKYFINTVFIGGGTPTCLSSRQLERLGDAIRKFCGTLSGNEILPIEFTVEANPGTIRQEQVSALKMMGVNRVSLGLQSAQNKELHALGRIHTFEEFLQSYELLRKNGIENINIDIMADIPLQTIESYEDTLQNVLKLQPQHISSYSLIVEEGTPFYQMQEQNKLPIPDEETDRRMYEMTQELLQNQGYQRYEISNYAQKGKECVHNLAYWQLDDYLGVGLGASSFLKGYRFQNECNMKRYREIWQDVREDTPNAENECSIEKFIRLRYRQHHHLLTKKEEMEEYVFLGLRMRRGISVKEYQERFQKDFRQQYDAVLSKFFAQSLLAEDKNHGRIYLTNRGIDVSNAVLAEFLLDE